MATELTLPTLGMDMSEATVVRWLVFEGDTVEKGDPVLEIDTDKTSFEVEAPESGTISSLTGDEGETLAVGTLLAYILAPGEDAPPAEKPPHKTEEEGEKGKGEEGKGEKGKGEASPEREAPEAVSPEPEAVSDSAELSGNEGHSTNGVAASGETDGKAASKGLRASPAARRLAFERGVKLSEISGSGPDGRVYLSDVKNFEAAQPSESEMQEKEEEKKKDTAPSVLPQPPGTPSAGVKTEAPAAGTRREKLSQVRRIGAERTRRSFSEVPHFYLRREINAGGLLALRARLKEKLEVAPSLNDLLAFAVSRTLTDHPRLNARFDPEESELIIHESVNLGVAAATERGLLVPVVRGAEKLRLRDLSAKTKELLAKARDGKLAREELTGSTFTISNLGMLGVDSFDAIVNQPEAAILAVGSLKTTPLWDGEGWVPQKTLSVTLSVDHRAADGADGARFLKDLHYGLSNWELLI